MSDSGHNTDGRPSQLIHELQHRIKVEEALERVRTASMAMQKSEDLKNVVSVLYKEIEPFGLATSTCTIHIFHEESQNTEVWVADGLDSDHIQSYYWYGREHPVIDLMWTKWEEKESHLDLHLKGARKKDLDEYLLTKTDYKNYPKELKKVIRSVDEIYFTCIYFAQGFIASTDFEVPNPEEKEILIRFVKAFDRAYTRFLDIQKAEKSAHEALIEACLLYTSPSPRDLSTSRMPSSA